ncbi:hypothetical protein X975_09286, partial [Stegodyphus mimosarum]
FVCPSPDAISLFSLFKLHLRPHVPLHFLFVLMSAIIPLCLLKHFRYTLYICIN